MECFQGLGTRDAGRWEIDREWVKCDGDGWSYAGDFTKFEAHLQEERSKSKPKIMHFVRR
jgi:hypothetical protein